MLGVFVKASVRTPGASLLSNLSEHGVVRNELLVNAMLVVLSSQYKDSFRDSTPLGDLSLDSAGRRDKYAERTGAFYIPCND